MAVREGGREAVTHWEVLERYGAAPAKAGRAKGPAQPVASLLLCRLETGRTHQIRVHLAAIGHPLMGDRVYGAGWRTKVALLPDCAKSALETHGRQALHAHILAVKHPKGKILEFRSELPLELARLHNELIGGRAEPSQKALDHK
jgi:23S rRNA pseudouridine1911/1915/1917 synthase